MALRLNRQCSRELNAAFHWSARSFMGDLHGRIIPKLKQRHQEMD